MKKTHILIVTLFLVALGISCTDESKYPVPFDTLNSSNAGILKVISQGSVILTSNIATSKYEVAFEANDRDRGRLFDRVELFVKFDHLNPANPGVSKPEKLLKTYKNALFLNDPKTGLPRITMTVPASEIMTLMGITLADIINGKDQFVFRQAMIFPDGKTYSTNNVTTPIAAGGGVYKSPFQNIVAINVCNSSLEGTVTYTTVVTGAVVPITPCLPSISGTTEFDKVTHGVYAIGDATFGQYDCAWNDTPAFGVNWVDFCDDITVTGADKYGLVYTFAVVSNNGTTLVIDWANNYGDTGRSTLTREGGWPLGLNFL